MANEFDQWDAFLNPDIVRARLIAAGLFLVAHEMLLHSIRRHHLAFFSDGWTLEGPRPSEGYRRKVLALDPKGRTIPYAALSRGYGKWMRSRPRMKLCFEA